MLGRFFPGNWRPPADEIRFAAENGFAALQIRTDRPGEIARDLRADLGEVGRVFSETGVEPVVEMLLRLSDYPSMPASAREPGGARRARLPSRARPPGARRAGHRRGELEQDLPTLFGRRSTGDGDGLILGVEHNAREHRLLVEPETCAALLADVPGCRSSGT